MKSKLFLIGYRGAGKSTIAPLVAQKLGWKLVDTDQVVKEKTGQTIAQLTQDGKDWAPFRQTEYEVFKSLIDSDEHMVVSAAGGIGVNDCAEPISGRTYGQIEADLILEAQNNAVCVVLLDAPIDVLIERILPRDPNHQPMLTSQSKTIEEDNRRVYAIRKPLYEALTNFRVNTSIHTPEQCAEIIAVKVNNEV